MNAFIPVLFFFVLFGFSCARFERKHHDPRLNYLENVPQDYKERVQLLMDPLREVRVLEKSKYVYLTPEVSKVYADVFSGGGAVIAVPIDLGGRKGSGPGNYVRDLPDASVSGELWVFEVLAGYEYVKGVKREYPVDVFADGEGWVLLVSWVPFTSKVHYEKKYVVLEADGDKRFFVENHIHRLSEHGDKFFLFKRRALNSPHFSTTR